MLGNLHLLLVEHVQVTSLFPAEERINTNLGVRSEAKWKLNTTKHLPVLALVEHNGLMTVKPVNWITVPNNPYDLQRALKEI